MVTLLWLGLQEKTWRSKKPNPNMSTLVIASCLVLHKHNKRILTHYFCRHWSCTGCNSINERISPKRIMHEREVIVEVNTYLQNQLGCASPTRCWKALRGSEKLKLLDLQLKGPMWEVKEMKWEADRYCPHKIATVTSLGLGLQENVPIKKNYDQTWPHLSLHRACLTWKYKKRILATICCHWPCKAYNTLNEGLVQRMHEEPFFKVDTRPSKTIGRV